MSHNNQIQPVNVPDLVTQVLGFMNNCAQARAECKAQPMLGELASPNPAMAHARAMADSISV